MSGRNFSIANGTVSATGTIIDNTPYRLATITPASATEGSGCVDFAKQPFCSRYFVYFVLINGTAGSYDY
jgi:hypothetical protein